MGTVSSSLNPGVADLLQTLSKIGSSTLNSSSVVSALKSAPTSDIVELSSAALQLQNVDTLFGIGSTPNTDLSTLLAELGVNSSTSSTSSTDPTPAEQAATAQSTAQMELTLGLFGIGFNSSLPGSLFSTFG